jgi:hypothetical protein
VVQGLTNGTAYTFTVRAHNEALEGDASPASAPVTPLGTPPTARIATLPGTVTTTAITVRWSATASSVPIADYDVRYRRARWSGSFGPRTTWKQDTTATSATFNAAKGYTYCYSARARDTQGGASAWTPETCTAVPLDDRSMSRSGGWTAGTSPADYAGTSLRTQVGGASVTLSGVEGRGIAVIVRKGPGYGLLRVYWRGSLIRTIDLDASTTLPRRVVTVATFGSVRTGTLRLQVVGGTGKVVVDGVAIRR